jgi:hypothetical protein
LSPHRTDHELCRAPLNELKVPSALTAELEEKQADKLREEKKRQREQKKALDKERALAAAEAAAAQAIIDVEDARVQAIADAVRRSSRPPEGTTSTATSLIAIKDQHDVC